LGLAAEPVAQGEVQWRRLGLVGLGGAGVGQGSWCGRNKCPQAARERDWAPLELEAPLEVVPFVDVRSLVLAPLARLRAVL
jgi:hypothetical protein